jgi:hypothetical protein
VDKREVLMDIEYLPELFCLLLVIDRNLSVVVKVIEMLTAAGY